MGDEIRPVDLIQALVRAEMVKLGQMADEEGEKIWADLFFDLSTRVRIEPKAKVTEVPRG